MLLSIVIPALNEAENIGRTVKSIRDCIKGPNYSYEIILVDNGSSDGTPEIAEIQGVKVIVDKEATIGQLRNIGAELASGKVLLFLDADTTLAENWFEEFRKIQYRLVTEKLITGSRCQSPSKSNFYSRFWFEPLLKSASKEYIGSAHLLLSRDLFTSINGFSSVLKTGEDHDLCIRARSIQAKIEPNESLNAIHHGYPNSTLNFFKRELWHGQGDMQKSLFPKEPIYFVAVGLLLNTLAIISSFAMGYLEIGIILMCCLISLVLLISKYKFKRMSFGERIGNASIIYVYCIARAFSIFIKGKRARS